MMRCQVVRAVFSNKKKGQQWCFFVGEMWKIEQLFFVLPLCKVLLPADFGRNDDKELYTKSKCSISL